MSHFSVVVRLPSTVDAEGVESAVGALLAPYHEFECTGRDDEYVQSVDQLEEARQEYESHVDYKLKSPEGEVFDKYDDRFYRDPTPEELKKHGPFYGSGCGGGISYTSKDWGDGRGYRPKVHEVPAGYEDFRPPTSESKSFAEFIEDYYGRKRLDGERGEEHKYGWYRVNDAGEVIEVIDRTNKNKKWDWWQIGGRWSGYFPVKHGDRSKTETAVDAAIREAEAELEAFQKSRKGELREADIAFQMHQNIDKLREVAIGIRRRQEGIRLGKSGTFRNIPDAGHSDYVRKREIDWDFVATKTRERIDKFWDEWQRFLAGEKFPTFEGPREQALRIGLLRVVREELKPEERERAIPWSLHVPAADERSKWHDVWAPVTREQLLTEYADAFSPISGFAFLDETGWHEPGKMGWFACSSDTPETLIASKQAFTRWLKETPDDAWLVVVDCHI